MNIRRLVTGNDGRGKSVLVSDGAPPRSVAFEHMPGLHAALLWETGANPQLGNTTADTTPASSSWIPSPGGTSAMLITFPPDSVMANPGFDPAAAGEEYLHKLPGLAEAFEPGAPGMHTTATIDYGVVLEGDLDLELDDGASVTLRPHDVVVQHGARHAWRNRSDRPAKVLFVLVGAKPSA